MKAIFIAYNQAYNEEIVQVLDACGQRGYTKWEDIGGRGSIDGEPHLGNHAWPTQNHALLVMVPDEAVDTLMDALRRKDAANAKLGLRAYVWNIAQSL
jgi:nitrogen regulatory protein PII